MFYLDTCLPQAGPLEFIPYHYTGLLGSSFIRFQRNSILFVFIRVNSWLILRSAFTRKIPGTPANLKVISSCRPVKIQYFTGKVQIIYYL